MLTFIQENLHWRLNTTQGKWHSKHIECKRNVRKLRVDIGQNKLKYNANLPKWHGGKYIRRILKKFKEIVLMKKIINDEF